MTYYLEHETEEWLYRPRKGIIESAQRKFERGKVRLVEIHFPDIKNWTAEQCEDFNLHVQCVIEDKIVNRQYLFTANVLSVQHIKKIAEKNENEIYVRNALLLKYYDEDIIASFVKDHINRANAEGISKAFDCLTHYLQYKNEEILYLDIKELAL